MNGRSINSLLEDLWFAPVSIEEPLYRYTTPFEHVWVRVETVLPMEKINMLDLKRDGFMPLYLHEIDAEIENAIVSTVMEC